MTDLVLGPVLRHVTDTAATVFVETDAPCAAGVLGSVQRTTQVEGHHYAWLTVRGLDPGTTTPYTVELDGVRRWPPPQDHWPAPCIRTMRPGAGIRVVAGSCRTGHPPEQPRSLSPARHPVGHGPDALMALAHELRSRNPREPGWPDLIVHLGDQVYADELSPEVAAFARRRGDRPPVPLDQAADFEEYARLYRESWTRPPLRWLLSTVGSAMIFDDHDVHDDWNTSGTWRRQMRALPWWEERITAAFASCIVYQHLGNLSPDELDSDPVAIALRQGRPDATQWLRSLGLAADREPGAVRFSSSRDLGRMRLVILDSRSRRRVDDDRDRRMVDASEWAWLEARLAGAGDRHLLLVSSLPVLLPPAIHDLEAWNEAVCAGAWGSAAARLGERVRQAIDLEHWAAFQRSFHDLVALLAARAGDPRPPLSMTLVGGDVHFSYLAEGRLHGAAGRGPGGGSRRLHQVVTSPMRNRLSPRLVRAQRVAVSRPARLLAGALARTAGVRRPPIDWRLTDGPWFDNVICELTLDGDRLQARLRAATAADRLQTVVERGVG